MPDYRSHTRYRSSKWHDSFGFSNDTWTAESDATNDPDAFGVKRARSEGTDAVTIFPWGGPVDAGANSLRKTAASILLQAAFKGSPNFAPASSTDPDICRGVVTSQVAEDMVRLLTRQLYRLLSRLTSESLEHGNRFAVIDEAMGESARNDPKDYCRAMHRMIFVDSNRVSEEAKSAALRYFSFLGDDIPLSELTRVLISAIRHGSEEQSVAAVRTLREIGDLGAIPAIRSAVPANSSERVKREVDQAMQDIRSAYGLSAST